MFAEDAGAFLRDFGSPVIFGAQTTWALFDQPDTDVLSGRAQSTQYVIEYPRADLVGLANNDIVLVGIEPGWKFDSTGTRLEFTGAGAAPESARFRVMGSPSRIEDGLFVQAKLQRI
jgi:hypothetical protein